MVEWIIQVTSSENERRSIPKKVEDVERGNHVLHQEEIWKRVNFKSEYGSVEEGSPQQQDRQGKIPQKVTSIFKQDAKAYTNILRKLVL